MAQQYDSTARDYTLDSSRTTMAKYCCEALEYLMAVSSVDKCKQQVEDSVYYFTQLHSWYKHLRVTGNTFYCIPMLGFQQQGITVEHTYEELKQYGAHWWFIDSESMSDIIQYLPIEVVKAAVAYPLIGTNELGNHGSPCEINTLFLEQAIRVAIMLLELDRKDR
jgi:hypothetical protein